MSTFQMQGEDGTVYDLGDMLDRSHALHARNQILADLLMRIFHDDDMYFDWSRSGYLTLDGGIVMTPEQMAALEDALLEHKARED